jgi:hypothetical protein
MMVLKMSPTIANSETAILSRTIRPEQGDLSPDAAKSLLNLTLPESDQRRANDLAARSCDGSLTELESVELDNYRAVGRLLELMKSKARVSLQKARAA